MQFPLAMARFHQAEKLLTFEDAKLTSLSNHAFWYFTVMPVIFSMDILSYID
jgi:hypothetical protein